MRSKPFLGKNWLKFALQKFYIKTQILLDTKILQKLYDFTKILLDNSILHKFYN